MRTETDDRHGEADGRTLASTAITKLRVKFKPKTPVLWAERDRTHGQCDRLYYFMIDNISSIFSPALSICIPYFHNTAFGLQVHL